MSFGSFKLGWELNCPYLVIYNYKGKHEGVQDIFRAILGDRNEVAIYGITSYLADPLRFVED